MADFRIDNHGSIYVLFANSEAAQEWVASNIPDDAQTWARHGVVVEHRYIGAIARGIQADGLTVE